MASAENMLKLKTAAEEGNLEEVKRLIETENVPVNSTDEVGDTALHAATLKGRLDIVKYLLSKGADPNVRNKTGSTTLHKVVLTRYDSLSILKVLLKSNADPTIRNAAGLLPEQLTQFNKARELLLGDQAVTDSVEVHKLLHGRIIGKAGSKINEIRDATGTVITIPEPTDQSNKIIINGRREGVEKAKVMIQEAVSQGKENNGEENDGKAFVRLPIAKEKHRIIVGREGRVVNDIREEHNVDILIPPPNSLDTNILVKGDTMEDVDAAVKKIYSLIKVTAGPSGGSGAVGGAGGSRGARGREGANGREHRDGPRNVVVYVPVPQAKHKHIIGKEGRTINELRNDFGVEIEIPPPDHPETRVTVKGETQDDVDAAVARIKEITERPSNSNGAGRGRADYNEGGPGQGRADYQERGFGRGRADYQERGFGRGRGEGERRGDGFERRGDGFERRGDGFERRGGYGVNNNHKGNYENNNAGGGGKGKGKGRGSNAPDTTSSKVAE